LVVTLILVPPVVRADTVTLSWNASSGPVAGYRVYYGQSSGNYSMTSPTAPSLIGGTTYTSPNLSPGTYYFAVKAFDSAGNSSGYSNEVVKTVAAAPTANFSANKTTGAAPLAVTFTDSSTNATAWSWNFGDGTTSTTRNPSKTYSNSGSYTVKLTATGPGGSVTATKANYITVTAASAAPVASFTASPTSGGAPLLVTLTDTSTGTVSARTWDLGDGTTSTAQSVAKTYNTAGSYTVKLTVTNAGGSTSTTRTMSVTAVAPMASFSATPTSGTAPLSTAFKDTSTGTITGYAWNFGDGTTSSASNPSHTYTKAGNYTVSLTTTGPAGSNTKTQASYIKVTAGTGALPSPWSSADIGSVGLAGMASYASGTFTLTGSGADIWGTADAFRFVYRPLNGDGTIVARVASLGNTASWAKTGVMIRESLDANARHAMVVITPANGVAFQGRRSTGGGSYHTPGAKVVAPYWVKLTRTGNTFTAYQSANGSTWVQVGSSAMSMATSAYVGLALTSHNNSLLNTAKLDSVSVTSP
jgi:PKD repeat protein